jgi:hypothetical protein
VALVGIGAFEPGSTLLSSGSTLSPEEAADLRSHGVVGDITLEPPNSCSNHSFAPPAAWETATQNLFRGWAYQQKDDIGAG